MKVLITGAGGNLGRVVVPALLEQGHTPRLMDFRPLETPHEDVIQVRYNIIYQAAWHNILPELNPSTPLSPTLTNTHKSFYASICFPNYYRDAGLTSNSRIASRPARLCLFHTSGKGVVATDRATAITSADSFELVTT